MSLCYILLLLNFWTFRKTLSTEEFALFQDSPLIPRQKMQEVFVTMERNYSQSHNYVPLKAGLAVGNCYNPLNREMAVIREKPSPHPEKKWERFLFLQGDLNPDCQEGSYFTQSEIHLDPSCPREVCLLLNSLNIYQKGVRERFVLRKERGKYCGR